MCVITTYEIAMILYNCTFWCQNTRDFPIKDNNMNHGYSHELNELLHTMDLTVNSYVYFLHFHKLENPGNGTWILFKFSSKEVK